MMAIEEPAEAGPALEATDASESVESAESSPVEAGAQAPASPPVTADTFGWDGWDGAVDSLPEPARGWAAPLQSHYTKQADQRIEQHTKDVSGLKELYEALLEGKTDPRVDTYAAQVKELEDKHTSLVGEWQGKYDTLESAYKQYQGNVEAAIDKEAEQYATWFKGQNPDVFSDERLATTFVALLEEGWEMESAATASRLPVAQLQAARQAKADGVPDSYALRLAGGAESPAAPRPGAKITSGATSPARSREQAMVPEKVEPTSFKDLRHQVARLALKRKG